AVRHAIQVVRESERAAAGDARALPWVRGLLDDAQRNQLEGEKLLFSAESETRGRAEPVLSDTVRAYEVLNRHIKTIADAQQLRDEALVFLPAFPSYLEFDPEPETTWLDGVRVLRDLQKSLEEPPSRAPGFF